MAVDTTLPRPAYGTALTDLQRAQKTNYGAPAYSRWVNRRLGRHIAAAAFVLGRTPNQVTAVSALLSAVGIGLLMFVTPSLPVALVATVFLLLGYAFDSADGQLARLRGGGSPAGEWLDHVVDTAKMVLVHGAVIISWLRYGVDGAAAPWWWAVVPVVFTAVSMTAFFGWLLSDLLRRVAGQPPSTQPRADGRAPALRSWLRLPSDYGLLALSFVLFGTTWFAIGYAALALVNLVILLAALPVWFGQVSDLRKHAEAT